MSDFFIGTGPDAIHAQDINALLAVTVSPKKFGAIGGGKTDDTAAIQAAIDYCLSKTNVLANNQSLIPTLEIDDLYLITSSLKIDRPINQSGFFRIRGKGVVGGLTTKQAIPLFSTNYVGSNKSNPALSVLSNQVSLENLNCSSSVAGATLIDLKKFVRTKITGCFLNGIQIDVSAGNDYIQSAYISGCFARGVTGKLINAVDMYDVRVTDCLFEVISDTIIYASSSIYGCAFNNNLAENCGGSYVNAAYAYGVEVNGNYAEANSGRFLKIDYVYGVEASSNYIRTRGAGAGGPDNTADATFYEMWLGECFGFKGSCNNFTHRGYQFEGISKIATVGIGDYAGVNLIKDTTGLNQSLYGSVNISGSNVAGTNSTLNIKNTAAGYNTQNLISFIHQTLNRVGIRSTLNVDANGSGNLVIETMDANGVYAERARLNHYQLKLVDGINLDVGTTIGTQIGTTALQKLAFYGKVPVVQPAAIANATDAASVITQLNSLLATLRTLGIIAT